jgi:hypothetical protein
VHVNFFCNLEFKLSLMNGRFCCKCKSCFSISVKVGVPIISSFLRLYLHGRYLRCTIVVIILTLYNVKEEDLHTTQNLYKLLFLIKVLSYKATTKQLLLAIIN